MRTNSKTALVVTASLLAALIFWLLDSLYGYYYMPENIRSLIYQESATFIDFLILGIPPHSLFARLLFLAACLTGGALSACFLIQKGTAEKMLAMQEKRYRLILENMPTGWAYHEVVTDRKGEPVDFIYREANSSFKKIIGIEKETLINRKGTEILPPHYLKSRNLMNLYKEVIVSRKSRKVEVFFKSIEKWFSINIFSREKNFFVTMLEDITIQKNNEIALKTANQQIEDLLASIDSLIIGISTRDMITHWNKSAEDIFGIPRSEAIGRRIIGMNLPWDWEKIYISIMECFTEQVPYSGNEVQFTDREGKERILGIAISRIIDMNENVTGFLIRGKDITEKKIMESQMLQDQKLKSIGELAAGIAHEINTPTQYVNNNLHFLNDSFISFRNLNEKYRHMISCYHEGGDLSPIVADIAGCTENMDIEFILEEAPQAIDQSLEGLDRIARIVSSMKDFSHPGQKQKTSLNLNKALRDMLEISKNEWKYHSDIKTSFDSRLPEIVCHPAEINTVFLNIIVNAAHALNEALEKKIIEKGIIGIATEDHDDYVIVTIKDNGTGIPENIRDRIFDPFFTTKEVGKGTGQGLAIAHTVITKYGGSISVDSEEGKGTAFKIMLPKADEGRSGE